MTHGRDVRRERAEGVGPTPPDRPRRDTMEGGHAGVRRWLTWLAHRLAPHRVGYEGVSSGVRSETRWRISFNDGPTVILHIPTYLVRAGEDIFEWTTMGMESYDWMLVLRQGGATSFDLNRNGIVLVRDRSEAVG